MDDPTELLRQASTFSNEADCIELGEQDLTPESLATCLTDRIEQFGCEGSNEIREWVQSPYLEDGGKWFLVKLYAHALEVTEGKDASELGLLLKQIAFWLRETVIGALSSNATASEITPSPTPNQMEETLDEMMIYSDDAQTRIRDLDFLAGRRDGFKEKLHDYFSINLVEKLGSMKTSAAEETLFRLTQGRSANDFIADPMTPFATTQAVHIIPFKLAHWKTTKEQTKRMIGWQALYHMFPSIRNILSTSNINSLCNVMTLTLQEHDSFRKFRFGLKHVTGNRYNFNLPSNLLNSFVKEPDGERYVELKYESIGEEVSRELLALHLAVAQVSRAIGAGEIAWIYDDDEEADLRSATKDPVRFSSDLTARLSDLQLRVATVPDIHTELGYNSGPEFDVY